jgi:hypothetical protein
VTFLDGVISSSRAVSSFASGGGPNYFGDVTYDTPRARSSAQLSKLAQDRFREAAQVKAPITQAIMECQRAMNGEPITGVHVDCEIPAVLNITATICEGLYALLVDAMAVSADELFTLKPTPQADLPPEAMQKLTDVLRSQQEQLAGLGIDVQYDEFQDALGAMTDALQVEIRNHAQAAAGALQATIRDVLVEGNFRGAMARALLDYCTSMAMVVKAPAAMYKPRRVWIGDRMEYQRAIVYGVERVDPARFFLSKGATDPHSADWVIELRRVIPSELLELALSPDYDAEGIKKVLEMYPQGRIEQEAGIISCLVPDSDSAYTRTYAYDMIVMSGKINGQLLIDMGVKVGDPRQMYEAEVCSIGDVAICALVNTDVSGKRRYHMASYYRRNDTPWGGSPASRLRDIQRGITSLYVALMGDAAMAGVHIEVNAEYLTDKEKQPAENIRPRLVRLVKAMPEGRPRAINIHQVTSQAGMFQSEIDRLFSTAYEVVGIPRMALGQTAGAGTLGRTAGGVASMLAMATKGSRRALKDIEEDIIEPVAQAFVDRALMFNPPPGFAGDINVQARGLSGLVEQAQSVDDLQWAFQTLAAVADKTDPMTGQLLVPPTALIVLIQEMFKAKGLPTDARIFPVDYTSRAALSGVQPNTPVPSQNTPFMGAARSINGAPAQVAPAVAPASVAPPLQLA